ncbi:hypothetical protein B4065_2052 [Caldibacillus thermoamylovorans]|nr:hypothetical protein B4065_2052 [Caldibacillus thermoamylovorans]
MSAKALIGTNKKVNKKIVRKTLFSKYYLLSKYGYIITNFHKTNNYN